MGSEGKGEGWLWGVRGRGRVGCGGVRGRDGGGRVGCGE